MKKGLMVLLTSALLVSSSLTAYAACNVHVADGNSCFVRVINARANGTHPYPKELTITGEVLTWGTCQDTVFSEEYAEHCIFCNCVIESKRTIKDRTEHKPQ